jgi:hypothetical protein
MINICVALLFLHVHPANSAVRINDSNLSISEKYHDINLTNHPYSFLESYQALQVMFDAGKPSEYREHSSMIIIANVVKSNDGQDIPC